MDEMSFRDVFLNVFFWSGVGLGRDWVGGERQGIEGGGREGGEGEGEEMGWEGSRGNTTIKTKNDALFKKLTTIFSFAKL